MTERNYIDELADAIRRRTPSELLPRDAEDLRRLFRLYALLACAKGRQVGLRDVHDAWVVWMLERGESHESMVPFEDLPMAVQQEDLPFVKAILSAVVQNKG